MVDKNRGQWWRTRCVKTLMVDSSKVWNSDNDPFDNLTSKQEQVF